MDGWCENSGGGFQGHRPTAPISRSPYQQRRWGKGRGGPSSYGCQGDQYIPGYGLLQCEMLCTTVCAAECSRAEVMLLA